MSKREIDSRFTKSELAVVAWRSQEVYAQIVGKVKQDLSGAKKQVEDIQQVLDEGTEIEVRPKKKTSHRTEQPKLPGKFFNDEGEVDLSRVTGPEALAYLASQGIKIPAIFPTDKKQG